MDIDNFSKQMDLMGQIEALLRVEMHVIAERKMLEAELAKLKQREATMKDEYEADYWNQPVRTEDGDGILATEADYDNE